MAASARPSARQAAQDAYLHRPCARFHAADGWYLHYDLTGRVGQVELYDAEDVRQTCLSGQIRPKDLEAEIAALYAAHGFQEGMPVQHLAQEESIPLYGRALCPPPEGAHEGTPVQHLAQEEPIPLYGRALCPPPEGAYEGTPVQCPVQVEQLSYLSQEDIHVR